MYLFLYLAHDELDENQLRILNIQDCQHQPQEKYHKDLHLQKQAIKQDQQRKQSPEDQQ